MHQKFNHGGWHFFAQYYKELLRVILLLVFKLSNTSYYSTLKTRKPASNTIIIILNSREIIIILTLIFFCFLSVFSIIFIKSPFYFRLTVVCTSFFFGTILSLLGIRWFFYSLVVIFLGGIMVVFVYASSLRNNFIIKLGSMGPVVIISARSALIVILNSQFTLVHKSLNPSMIYSSGVIAVIIVLSVILLLVLFVISKVVKVEDGAIKL